MIKYRDLTVLISASNSPSIPGIVKCLKENGERNIRVVGVDMNNDPSSRYVVDSFYTVPVATAPNYCDVILDICKKEEVDIYFPGISAEVAAIIRRKTDFDLIGVVLSVSNQESVEVSNDKLRTYQLLEKAGIKVPRYISVKSEKDFVEGCKQLGYPEKPVCIKIVNGSGSRGVRIVDSNKSLYDLYAYEKANSLYTSYDYMVSTIRDAIHLEPMMLLEYMHGPEYTVDLLAEKGKVIYEVGRENVVSVLSIAQESVLKYDKVAYETSEAVVKLFNMDGNVGFDFMRNEEGWPFLMDINPRITATISIIAAGGVNLIYLRIKQLLGEQLPPLKPIYGTRVKRRYGEIYTTPNGDIIDRFC